MYCRDCYADLTGATDAKCLTRGRAFDPADPRTALRRPFPPGWRVVGQVVATTLLAAAAAFVVAVHQAARSSGH